MDTIEPCFEDLIVEQCARHLTQLKSFEGIAIDRLDYSEFLCVGPYPTAVCSAPFPIQSGRSKTSQSIEFAARSDASAVQQPGRG